MRAGAVMIVSVAALVRERLVAGVQGLAGSKAHGQSANFQFPSRTSRGVDREPTESLGLPPRDLYLRIVYRHDIPQTSADVCESAPLAISMGHHPYYSSNRGLPTEA
jgi:hypothetical protein